MRVKQTGKTGHTIHGKLFFSWIFPAPPAFCCMLSAATIIRLVVRCYRRWFVRKTQKSAFTRFKSSLGITLRVCFNVFPTVDSHAFRSVAVSPQNCSRLSHSTTLRFVFRLPQVKPPRYGRHSVPDIVAKHQPHPKRRRERK
jgi:hypothetical protein